MKSNLNRESILKNDTGFTLIEVLVAITILSMLMATMYTIVNDSTESKDQIIAEDRDALQLVTALDRMEQDFAQFYSPLYFSAKYSPKNADQNQQFGDIEKNDSQKQIDPLASYEASERYPAISTSGNIVPKIENESKTELSFLTTANRRILEDSKQSRYAWVKYALRSSTKDDYEKKEGADYELTRAIETENIYKKDFNWENVKEYPLLRGIKSFQFLFWNSKTEKFVDKLDLLSTDKETPRLVKILMVWINSDNNEVKIERTFRPLSPFFDTEKDEKEKENALKGNQKPGTPGAPVDNEEEEL
ncbi:prepilin-type N-terminal cleavage/methylation domain-containing protein [Halobacteriovorax sp. JY17]|uniref:PulJ/GspJ family protein n=1 Tax=Halobacteriovorax sp. JY17 TaxID=2014617 RepID=UPI000C3A6F71|nr:prepilin-type N-terminal cleavage/methylation domain-containing protein [Halobacteriovorax sp. JY17]PIK15298.1 MAG: hypothetical protein CES88_00885 [Halobacteriovorax sp. JY17]